ncbi:N-acetyl-gamma-glutamyl-phosphate reductase [Novipirellula galeiformis]|uniref:N-acetyl-gamma-glutamyl-phosphate reductase n=1 Tax=Novipirellula galeiformis TaxID=2528004 RepID=A0A5C6CLQ5_9BACT|nr:N-acetyl-gamma-glutamyl-phosphate reductase [Novipirellula galeiformis]TWU24374.1 N-acetyl-gamma-glutamyl-phosphate reductase [Novipirellula galeiformis]
MTIRVGIVGATGYTALEVARLLLAHPEAELVAATSRAEEGTSIAEIHPELAGRCEVAIESLDPASLAKKCDVVMCCLPHGASAETCKELVAEGVRVIDFSADFRLSDQVTYEKWYGVEHPWPERIGSTVYGLPEFFAEQIRQADLVANPGCYPTSAILPLAPLIANQLIEATDIIVDSKSGVSGAGRSAKVATLYCEVNESIAAYGVGCHRHQPEMADLVQRIGGQEISLLFTPHLTPMDRGILSTIYVRPRNIHAAEVMACWRKQYADSPFVNAVDHLPATKHVSGTNYVQMSARDAGDRIVLVSAIDNLTKGASGAAIQNMNVMFGLEQTTGL